MTQLPWDIEQVVREVAAELQRAEGAAAGLQGATAGLSSSAGADSGELTLDCRLLTMSDVDGRLAGVRRVVIPLQAVVTPAVRDEFARRNIALRLASGAKPQAAGVRLTIMVSGTRVDAGPLAAALGREGIEVQTGSVDCVIAATDQLAAAICETNTLGVLLTPHTAAALCLANRHRGVRAILGTDDAAVAVSAAAVGANLLIIDPAAMAFFPLKQMTAEFCRGGVRPCPKVFQQRLG